MMNEQQNMQHQERGEANALSAQPERVVFRGTFSHTVDGKGRVSVPSEYRRSLGFLAEDAGAEGSIAQPEKLVGGMTRSIVLTNMISGEARCLEGYCLLAWQEFERKLREKSRFDPRVQQLEMFYVSRAVECEIDGSGRIMLPQNLRSYAALEKEVVFSGSIHGFKLWDKRVWEHLFSAAEEAVMSDPEVFSGLDI
jgi:MraZ protein